MKITKVQTIPIVIPTKSFGSAFRKFGPMRRIGFVIVKVYSDNGLMGVGEAIARTGFYGEPLESVKFAIDKYLGPRIIGKNPFDLEQILSTMDWALFGNSCAKSGIELAIYDLIGKALDVPVYQLLGGCYRDKILVGIEVGTESPENMAKTSVEYVEKGIRVLKAKVGGDPNQDIERIRAIREAVGGDVTLRADANEGWTQAQAIRFIKKSEEYNLELIEQPVPRWDIDGLARVRKAVDTPIEADESACSFNAIINIIRKEAADIINIKLAKAGGLYNSKRISVVAEAAGIPCLVGTEFGLGIGIAAKLHLAASTKNINYASEFTELYLFDNLSSTPFEIQNGYLSIPSGTGLGVQLDENKLKKFSISDIEHGDFDETRL